MDQTKTEPLIPGWPFCQQCNGSGRIPNMELIGMFPNATEQCDGCHGRGRLDVRRVEFEERRVVGSDIPVVIIR